MGNKLCRSLCEFGKSPVECSAVGYVNRLQQLVREIERNRGQLAVDLASGRSERQKCLAHICPVGATSNQLATFQQGDGARNFGLMHMAMGADGLSRHHAKLTKRDKHTPFRNPNLITV